MKIVALNIRHGGGSRIESLISVLIQTKADIIVLTEFRFNNNSNILRNALNKEGYSYATSSSKDPIKNAVAVYSKINFSKLNLVEIDTQQKHRLLMLDFDEFVLMPVYFAQKREKKYLFDYLFKNLSTQKNKKICLLGDFNAGLPFQDEVGNSFYCVKEFKQLLNIPLIDSWRSRNPNKKEFSWYSNSGGGFRIDHILSSPIMDQSIKSIGYDHLPRLKKVTDHSLMHFSI